jgi:hypothetical protein
MRKDLLDFVVNVDKTRPKGSNPEDLAASSKFAFNSLKEELCIGGVYVRIFNKTSETNDIDDPSRFCLDLIAYIWKRLQNNNNNKESSDTASRALEKLHLDYAVESLRTLTEALDYIIFDVAKAEHGIETVFTLLSSPPTSGAFASSAQLLGLLFAKTEFATAVSINQPPVIWRLLRCLSTVDVPEVSHAWNSAEALAAHPEGLNALLDAGAIVHVLGTLLAVKGYSNTYASRIAAVSLLNKFMLNPVKGSDAAAFLRK